MTAPWANIEVVDPVYSQQSIKPTDILHVVLTEDGHKGLKKSNISWRMNKASKIGLKMLRSETYFNDSWDRNVNSRFEIIGLSDIQGGFEQHYWFRVDPHDGKAIQELKDVIEELGTIYFYDGKSLLGNLAVDLIVRQEDKRNLVGLLQETVWSGKDPIAVEANSAGLTTSLVDEKGGYVLNPSPEENLWFEVNQRAMLVEFAEFLDLPRYKVSIWQTENNMDVRELTERHINGKRIQRFLITNRIQSMFGIQGKRLGEVNFRNGNAKQDRKLKFLITPERDEDQDDDDVTCLWEYAKRPKLIRKVKVEIEELKGKGLMDGVNTCKTFLPKPKRNMIMDPVDGLVVVAPPNENLIVAMPKNGYHGWLCECSGKCLQLDNYTESAAYEFYEFAQPKKAKQTNDMLTFRIKDRIRRVHVCCPGIVGELKCGQPTHLETERVMEVLWNCKKYVTAAYLSTKTGISLSRVKEVLSAQESCRMAIPHSAEKLLWKHARREEMEFMGVH